MVVSIGFSKFSIILSGIKVTLEYDIFGMRRDLNPGFILNKMHSTPELHPRFYLANWSYILD